MFEYKAHKKLFDFLSLEENPKMHQGQFNRLGHGSTHHGIILEATKSTIGATQFIALTCDEVNYINNQN
jgi:hypothetical protein